MPAKGPVSTPTKRLSGDPTGSLRRGRGFPPQSIDLTSITDTETPGLPVFGYDRASIAIKAGTIGTAVVEIEGGIGDDYETLTPRLRLDTDQLSEFDFNIERYATIRVIVQTADAAASDNAVINAYAFNKD